MARSDQCNAFMLVSPTQDLSLLPSR
uniref:Uncharacterized protein n=1 Tax=Anguilla anguilla TaxID=7936 RepID=A0A0E9RBV9_ANGAN